MRQVGTTELACVNTMLSGIGEAPVNSLEGRHTADVLLARRLIGEVSTDIQLDGWQWNTEDNYPLKPSQDGRVKLHPDIIRVHFREPEARELAVRGRFVFNRTAHSFFFKDTDIFYVTVTWLLAFDDLPESARRYIGIRAMRVFQERTVGSGQLSQFHREDEVRAKNQMLLEERKQDRPNIIAATGTAYGMFRPMRTGQWYRR